MHIPSRKNSRIPSRKNSFCVPTCIYKPREESGLALGPVSVVGGWNTSVPSRPPTFFCGNERLGLGAMNPKDSQLTRTMGMVFYSPIENRVLGKQNP